MRSIAKRALPALLSVIGVSFALPAAQAQPVDFGAYRPSAEISRISRDQAPTIDGVIDPSEWAAAAAIEQFYQIDPVEGGTPSQRTRIMMMYDERNLYFAVYSYDDEPELIRTTVMQRDGAVYNDDNIRILLDTYDSGRDAFMFQVNPLGARRDALIENNDDVTDEWDTIWRAQARIVDDGWVLEIEIPFQSISADANANSWGLQVARKIARNNERMRWASINRSRNDIDMSFAGRLSGVRDINNGRGLDVATFGIARWTRNWEQPREDDFKFEASGNAFYKITPALTGTLTLNTDFSDTPLDSRQVNTSRFSLFFPETRDFFLQDQALFAFGGRPFNNSNGQPFFSRRIGIVNGSPVDILAGGKLSGSLGRYNIGALTTRTRSTEVLDPQQLTTVRASAEVLDGSRVGLIVTNGDPTGETENTVAGADFQYRNSNFFGSGGQFVSDFYYLRSISDTPGDDGDSFGMEAAYPNDRWSWRSRFKQIDATYDPKLGFVNRPGVRDYNGSLRRRWRPTDSFIRFFNVGTWWEFTTDLDNELESRENGWWFGGVTQAGDELFFNFWNSKELIREDFSLPNNVVVPAGDYRWTRGNVFALTSGNRPLSVEVEFVCCDWFDGTRRDYFLELNYRPAGFLSLNVDHTINDISLPSGDVTIHINSIDTSFNFSPDMTFSSEIQYDNISKGLTYFGRFRWEVRPQTEIFVALSHGAVTNFNDFRSIQSGSVIRIGNTFRF